MSFEPCFHAWMLVGFVIVHDQVQVEIGRGLAVYFLEETDKFLMPMARQAVVNNRAVEHAEGRKQRCCAVSFVIVRHGPASALFHRQTRLSPVESLHLALLLWYRNESSKNLRKSLHHICRENKF